MVSLEESCNNRPRVRCGKISNKDGFPDQNQFAQHLVKITVWTSELAVTDCYCTCRGQHVMSHGESDISLVLWSFIWYHFVFIVLRQENMIQSLSIDTVSTEKG